MMSVLLHEQAIQQLNLGVGKGASAVRQVFNLLESLDEKENNGLYVGHRGTLALLPNDLSKRTLNDVMELAGESLDGIGPMVRRGLPAELKQQAMRTIRETARAVKQVAQSVPSQRTNSPKGTPASTGPKSRA